MGKFLMAATCLLTFAVAAHAYEGPAPLQNIGVEFNGTLDSSTGIYSYNYKVTNPSSNNGEVRTIRISIQKNPQSDADLSSGLSHCRHHGGGQTGDLNLNKSVIPVGSSTPDGWSCDYMPQGLFSFGSIYPRNRIKPGASVAGYVLKSYAPPGIQNIVVDPAIDLDQLPDTYNENVDKLTALENSVRWSGQVIAPKAPPKVFSAVDFISYLISLKDQSVAKGWIKDNGIANSLDAKLNDAKKKIVAADNKTAKNVLGAFQNDLQAQNGKKISAEAYALLYFNSKYLIDHL